MTVIVLQLPANGYRCFAFCRLYYRSCLIVKDTCRTSSKLAALHRLESPLSCFTGLISLSSSCMWTRCQVDALFCKTAMVLVSVLCSLERCGPCGQLTRRLARLHRVSRDLPVSDLARGHRELNICASAYGALILG